MLGRADQVEAGEGANARDTDKGESRGKLLLAGVQRRAVEARALRLMDGDRPRQDERNLEAPPRRAVVVRPGALQRGDGHASGRCGEAEAGVALGPDDDAGGQGWRMAPST